MATNPITEIIFEPSDDHHYDDSYYIVRTGETRYVRYPEPIQILRQISYKMGDGSIWFVGPGISNILLYGPSSRIFGKIFNTMQDPDVTMYVGSNVEFGPDSDISEFRIVRFNESIDGVNNNDNIPDNIKQSILEKL